MRRSLLGHGTELMAQKLATFYHRHETRHDGSKYITHPLNVAQFVKDYAPFTNGFEVNSNTVAIALMHDLWENTSMPRPLVRFLFSSEVYQGLETLTHRKYNPDGSAGETKEDYIIRVLKGTPQERLVKHCDNLENMETLEFLPDPKKRDRKVYLVEKYILPDAYKLCRPLGLALLEQLERYRFTQR